MKKKFLIDPKKGVKSIMPYKGIQHAQCQISISIFCCLLAKTLDESNQATFFKKSFFCISKKKNILKMWRENKYHFVYPDAKLDKIDIFLEGGLELQGNLIKFGLTLI